MRVRHSRKTLIIVSALLSIAAPTIAFSAPPDPQEIIDKSTHLYSGDDSISRLTFSFREKGQEERKIVYSMVWKAYKDDKEFTDKMIFFKEFPTDQRGTAFMLWLYKPEVNHDDDQWLYLPELRTIRKLTKKIEMDSGSHGHGHGSRHDKDDDFAKSALHRPHLAVRPGRLDELKLLETKDVDGQAYYIIERKPKKRSDDYPYLKTINWISTDNLLLTRIDYFNDDDKQVMRQDFEWEKIGKAWVWKQVKGVDLETENTTVLDISDIRVNIGLEDDDISKRLMKLGIDGLHL